MAGPDSGAPLLSQPGGHYVVAMDRNAFFASSNSYYEKTLDEHGATARGVDYNSREAHDLRFQQLAKLFDASERFSLLDYGCGHGALAHYLADQGLDFTYVGFDAYERMIDLARRSGRPGWEYTSDEAEVRPAEYTIASGLFNLKFDVDDATWTGYVLDTLAKIDALSTRGFAFNILTKYSDPPRMRADLHYADPSFYFDYCKLRFARDVALLHDYGAYEFTVLVQK